MINSFLTYASLALYLSEYSERQRAENRLHKVLPGQSDVTSSPIEQFLRKDWESDGMVATSGLCDPVNFGFYTSSHSRASCDKTDMWTRSLIDFQWS